MKTPEVQAGHAPGSAGRSAVTTTVQLDLFATAPAGTNRLADACTVLAEALPYTMGFLFARADASKMAMQMGYSGGDWAYRSTTGGLRFEHTSAWGGWNAKLAHLITWDEVDALAADRRLAPVRAWVTAGGTTVRPHELWPRGHSWHPDYIANDHATPGWPQRLKAWQLLINVLTDRAQLARGIA